MGVPVLVEGESGSNEPKIIETRGINPVTCSSEQVKEIIAEGHATLTIPRI